MALTDYKLTNEEIRAGGAQSLPTVPSTSGYTAATLKAAFDNVSQNVIAPKYNDLIDQLVTDETATDGRIDALEALTLTVVDNKICMEVDEQ